MSRGESGKESPRGPGLAIGAAFAAICLLTLFVVVLTTRACEGMFDPAPVPGAPEPFAGAEATLRHLGTAGCLDAISTAGTPIHDLVEQTLDDRGYGEADADWSDPVELPLDAPAPSLGGGCGVVAVVAEGSGWMGAQTRHGESVAPCRPDVLLVPACDDDRVVVHGVGQVRRRAFVMPGVTKRQVEELGMPVDAVLGHAEAEVLLVARGYTAHDRITEVPIAGSHAHGFGTVGPPSRPPSGCVAWVAVALGVGGTSVRWDGRLVDNDAAQSQGMAGLVSCAGGAPNDAVLQYDDPAGDGGRVFFRPFVPGSGLSLVPATVPAPTGIASLTAVAPADLGTPAGIARVAGP